MLARVHAGQTVSEGGFDANKVANAALLGVATEKDKKGKTYYKFEILTRTGVCCMSEGSWLARYSCCTWELIASTFCNRNLWPLIGSVFST